MENDVDALLDEMMGDSPKSGSPSKIKTDSPAPKQKGVSVDSIVVSFVIVKVYEYMYGMFRDSKVIPIAKRENENAQKYYRTSNCGI